MSPCSGRCMRRLLAVTCHNAPEGFNRVSRVGDAHTPSSSDASFSLRPRWQHDVALRPAHAHNSLGSTHPPRLLHDPVRLLRGEIPFAQQPPHRLSQMAIPLPLPPYLLLHPKAPQRHITRKRTRKQTSKSLFVVVDVRTRRFRRIHPSSSALRVLGARRLLSRLHSRRQRWALLPYRLLEHTRSTLSSGRKQIKP